jgi:hypothetical protein
LPKQISEDDQHLTTTTTTTTAKTTNGYDYQDFSQVNTDFFDFNIK